MKFLNTFALASILLSISIAVAVDEVDIRGPVSEVINEKFYIWGPQDFAGFFYDAEEGLGCERIKMRITEGNVLRKDNVIYESVGEPKKFEFGEWGSYLLLGFLGEKYFAGYTEDTRFYDGSNKKSLLDLGYLSRILINSNSEENLASRNPLKLEEGYEISLKAVGNNQAYIILTKEGDQVDSAIIEPDDKALSTYTYKKKMDNSEENYPIIAVHFKNCFNGSGISIASYDGVFQISEEFNDVKEGGHYGNMSIKTSEKDKIVLRNTGDIYLTNDEDIPLMGDFWLRTADQRISSTEPLRFCIYKRAFEPGIYLIRGPIAPIMNGEQVWNAEKFSGFYYDINDNIKTENIRFSITENNQLKEATGVEYSTYTQKVPFTFNDWGKFYVIGFMGEKYFASYASGSYIFNESDDSEDLMSDQKLSKVLIDSKKDKTIFQGGNLWLEEGYILEIKSIDIYGNQVILELKKDGLLVDSKVVSPSKKNATLKDKTYCYKKSIENYGDMIIIAVHFKDAFRGATQNLSTIDGVWQISEKPTDIKVGTEYDKMKIVSNDNREITMNNKCPIALNKKSQPLMEYIAICASDEEDLSGSLRNFNLYKEETIERSIPISPNDLIYPTRKGLA